MDNNYSLADIAAASGNEGFGGGGAWWIIILFLFVFMGGGGGLWGNNGRQCATTADVQDGFNFAALERQMNEGRAETIASESNLAQLIKDTSYNNLSNIKDIEAAIALLQSNADKCCCETNRNIDAVRYENAQNTCAITTAIHAEGEQTRALITENTIQALRDKVGELSLAQSQCAQNAYLVNQLRPYPAPAYPVSNPMCSCGYGGFGGNGAYGFYAGYPGTTF